MTGVPHDLQVSSLVRQINDSVQDLGNDDIFKSGEARVRVQEAARKLATTLETPAAAVFRHAFEVKSVFFLEGLELLKMDDLDFSVVLYKAWNHPAVVSSAFRIRQICSRACCQIGC